MKTSVIFLLLFISISSVKAVTIVNVTNDTTITGTWNLNNSVLNISAKIRGTCTITNAIIQASPFIQIFDTTVTIGSGCKTDKFSGYWFGGKPGLADNYRPLQKCIDACTNQPYPLYIPGGQWKILTPLLVAVWNGTDYSQARIRIYGDATFWDNGSGTQILYQGSSRFAINFQVNKGSEVDHLRFTGAWVSPGAGLTDSVYYNITFANYTNQSVSGGGSCAGIAIDNYGTGTSGSTGCSFHDLLIENFQTLIQISNNTVFNGEILRFTNIQFGDCKEGVVTSQAQEKCNVFDGVYCWGHVHTLFDIGTQGKGQAGYYIITNANIAGSVIRLFNINIGGWFPTEISNFYAENFATIGTISTGLPVSVKGSVFDFILPTQIGQQVLLGTGGNSLKFDDCVFRFYGLDNQVMKVGPATFENCFFNGTTQANSDGPNILIKYYNGTVTTTAQSVVQSNLIDTVHNNPVKMSIHYSSQ